METITVVIVIILLIAMGIFVGTQITGNSIGGGSAKSYSSFPAQASGGGCGR